MLAIRGVPEREELPGHVKNVAGMAREVLACDVTNERTLRRGRMKSVFSRVLVMLIVVAGIGGAYVHQISPAVAQPAGTIEIRQVCVNLYNGSIRNSATCTYAERAVALPDDGPLYACANLWTGRLRAVWGPGQCSGSEMSLDLAGGDVVNVCVSVYTGKLRYARTCSSGEYSAFAAPARVASIYVADSGANMIKQFTLDGQFIRQWGGQGSGPGQFDDLYRIAVGPDGTVYATDGINCRVQTFTYYGAFIAEWGSCGDGSGQFGLPAGIEVDPQGNVFVTDIFNFRVQKFDKNGNLLTTWGSAGSDPGEFLFVFDVAVDSSANVFVTDPLLNNRVQQFDNNGSYLDAWAIPDEPIGIDIDTSSNTAYVTTSNDTVIKIDASNGNVITQWGSTGTNQGQFDEAQDVAVASNGLIYVLERENARVQYFDENGAFVGVWGVAGTGIGQFDDITSIAATP